MFFTRYTPTKRKSAVPALPAAVRTASDTQMQPGGASACSRAAKFTALHYRSLRSAITSPTLMPIRNAIRRISGIPTLRRVMPRWISTAHSRASTTLAGVVIHRSAVGQDGRRDRVRCEVDFTHRHIRFYALRRRDPRDQPLLRELPYLRTDRPFRGTP